MLSLILGFGVVVLYRGGIPLPAVLFFAVFTSGLLLASLFLGKGRFLKESRMAQFFTMGLALFALLFVLASIFSDFPGYGARDFFLWSGGAILFLLFSRISLREEERTQVSKGLLVIAFLSAVLGVVFFLTLAQPRFFGSFGDPAESYAAFPNAYANLLLFLIPVAYHFLLKAQKKSFWFWTFLVAFLSAGFFLSLSRGAMLAFLATGFLALLLLRPGPKDFRFVLKKTVPLVLLSFLLFNGLQMLRGDRFEVVTLVEKVSFQSDEGTTSQDERVRFWLHSLEMIQDRPLLGGGPDSFALLYPQYQDDFGAISGHPHNLFLKVGVEEGLLAMGLLLFLAVIFWSSALSGGAYRSPYFYGLLAGGLHNLVDYNLNFGSIVLLMALFAAWVFQDAQAELSSRWRLFRADKTSSKFILTLLIPFVLCLTGLALNEFYYKLQFLRGVQALEQEDLLLAGRFFERATRQIWEEALVLNLVDLEVEQADFEQARLLLEEAMQTIQDPRYFTELGLLSPSSEEAGQWFLAALQMNPHNEIEYYYHVARTVGYDRQALIDLLGLYQQQLSQNFHNTLLSQNPKYADQLYAFLIETAVEDEEMRELIEDRETFNEIWLQQIAEFEALFKLDLPSPSSL